MWPSVAQMLTGTPQPVAASVPATPVSTAPPQQSTAQRLQELETLRVTGVITDAEYARKREQIISEL